MNPTVADILRENNTSQKIQIFLQNPEDFQFLIDENMDSCLLALLQEPNAAILKVIVSKNEFWTESAVNIVVDAAKKGYDNYVKTVFSTVTNNDMSLLNSKIPEIMSQTTNPEQLTFFIQHTDKNNLSFKDKEFIKYCIRYDRLDNLRHVDKSNLSFSYKTVLSEGLLQEKYHFCDEALLHININDYTQKQKESLIFNTCVSLNNINYIENTLYLSLQDKNYAAVALTSAIYKNHHTLIPILYDKSSRLFSLFEPADINDPMKNFNQVKDFMLKIAQNQYDMRHDTEDYKLLLMELTRSIYHHEPECINAFSSMFENTSFVLELNLIKNTCLNLSLNEQLPEKSLFPKKIKI